MHQGSSSSDDNLIDMVTHRHIETPRFYESESGHHATDFLHQFQRKLQTEQQQKKAIQEVIREKTTDINLSHSQSTASMLQAEAQRATDQRRLARTNTFSGTETRHRAPTDTNIIGNMAEMRPIMPQQYRPSRPPPYREALERRELIKSGISEIERIKQTVNSARAKQLYAKSLQLFEQQNVAKPRLQTRQTTSSRTENNNTIGVVKTGDKKIVIKRASPRDGPGTIFYQPNSTQSLKQTSTNSLASSFYRPSEPPAYKDVMKRRNSKPDLIDSLGGESLVWSTLVFLLFLPPRC